MHTYRHILSDVSGVSDYPSVRTTKLYYYHIQHIMLAYNMSGTSELR